MATVLEKDLPRTSRESAAAASSRIEDRHLPAIDGLRGLAIIAVVFHHFGVHPHGWFDWGPVGPSVFFMLSGFFITKSLWRIQERGLGVWRSVLKFHSRRLLRLAPPVIVLIGVGALLGIEEYRETWSWHLLFLTNFLVIFRSEWVGSLSHLWSLAVQEQFYILWTLILFVPRSRFVVTMLCVGVCALLFRTVSIAAGSSDFARWLLLPGSLDAFAAGALAAWIAQRASTHGMPRIAFGRIALIAAVASLLFSRWLRFLPDTHLGTALVEVFQGAFFFWLLLFLLQHPKSRIAGAFCWKPLLFVGRLSFGIFVFHTLIAVCFGRYFVFNALPDGLREFVYASILLALSIGFAIASRALLEEPVKGIRLPEIPNIEQISSRLAVVRRIGQKFAGQ